MGRKLAGTLLATLEGHTNRVLSVAWSPPMVAWLPAVRMGRCACGIPLKAQPWRA
jgi:hypothetical protein